MENETISGVYWRSVKSVLKNMMRNVSCMYAASAH